MNDAVIYCLTCSVNGKRYIGRTRQPDMRFHSHLSALKSNRHPNESLQHDFNVFGESAFSFEILLDRNCGTRTDVERDFMVKYKTGNPRYGYNHNDPIFLHNGKRTKFAMLCD